MNSKKNTRFPKVIFKFNKKLDAENYFIAANSNPKWGGNFTKTLRPEVLKMLRGKKWEEIEKPLMNMLNQGYSKDKTFMKNKLNEISYKWKKVETKYFVKLEKVTKHKIFRKIFPSYITTIGRCPYSVKYSWFMISIFNSTNWNIGTIAHEIMHLQFHYYYEKELRKQLNHEQFQDLKEALTVLLNVEFKQIISEEDKGYPNHKYFRKYIVKEWKKKKDFDVLMEKCIKYLKKHPSYQKP